MRKIILTSVGVGAACFMAGIAFAANQPHMYAALSMLQNARAEMAQADEHSDHGGHAEAATALIDQAIAEVQAGIDYRNTH
jgi:hypothetical protein